MSDDMRPEPGSIGWIDLTVPDADRIRDFYAAVTGWTPKPVSMGDYSDYCMNTPEGGKPTAGVCHARGVNADLPAQWLLYIIVEDLDRSMDRCRDGEGEVIAGPRSFAGQGRFCVIRDPAGAVSALFQPEA